MENKIKEVIANKGITQKKLAEMVGMSEIGIGRAIKGSATEKTLSKIADVLEVDINDLYDRQHVVARKAIYEGELHLGQKVLPCAVLDDGTRVVTASAVFDAFDRPRKGKSSESYRVDRMPSFINANNLQPFVDEQLIWWTCLIKYTSINGVVKEGYNARVIRGLCKVYIDARNANALHPSQERFAAISESILYALSDIGIIALVDEATGYDKAKERAKDELQKYLQMFLYEEADKWVKTFNDQFFEDLYKMRHWDWNKTAKRPGIVGTWINDIVYERIAPIILEELKKRNPKNENGNRKWKHHQLLTADVGKPKLQQHLEALHAMAVISDYNWAKFMAYLDKTYPKQHQQLSFIFDDE